jgi:hypothetical protein
VNGPLQPRTGLVVVAIRFFHMIRFEFERRGWRDVVSHAQCLLTVRLPEPLCRKEAIPAGEGSRNRSRSTASSPLSVNSNTSSVSDLTRAES